MSPFFLQQQQIHCNCFGNTPKKEIKPLRKHPNQYNNLNQLNPNSTYAKKYSEEAKSHKKSLKKKRQLSILPGEKEFKKNDESYANVILPDIPTSGSPCIVKNDHKPHRSKNSENKKISDLNLQKKPTNHSISLSTHRQVNQNKFQNVSLKSKSQIKNIYDDRKLTEQFQRDLLEMNISLKDLQSERKIKEQHKKNLIYDCWTLEDVQHKEPSFKFYSPAQQFDFPTLETDKIQEQFLSLKSASVHNKYKKEKIEISLKQTQSLRISQSPTESDRHSEVIGKGFEIMNIGRSSFSESEGFEFQCKTPVQTPATTIESQIKNCQIKTFTDFSNFSKSSKVFNNNSTVFGRENREKLPEKSFQQLSQFKPVNLGSYGKISC